MTEPHAFPESVPYSVRRALRDKIEVCSPEQVEFHVDQMAVRITVALQDRDPVFLVVQHGGVVLAGMLARRLGFPCQWGYVHASRYGDRLEPGELRWLGADTPNLQDKVVVFIDDIADRGKTLASLSSWAEEQGATTVQQAVLVHRVQHCEIEPDYVGLDVADGFLLGCGMDVHGYGRNLAGIYKLAD